MNHTISQDGQSITCHECGRTSHNPNDVRNRYCGNCHEFYHHRPDPEDDDCLLSVLRQSPLNGRAETHPDHASWPQFLRLAARGLITLHISGDRMEVECRPATP